MATLAGPLAMPMGGDPSGQTGLVFNPSRGGVAPSTTGYPLDIKALDKIRASFRSVDSAVDLTSIRANVGFSKAHALGADGRFEAQFKRTKLWSLLGTTPTTTEATIATVLADGLSITKNMASPQPSVYFTSIVQEPFSKNAMISATLRADHNPSFGVDSDPLGPLIGLEYGPRNTAVYVALLDTGTFKELRVCGPSVDGVRSPDLYFPFDWGVSHNQYIVFWNEVRSQVEVWADTTTEIGSVGVAQLVAIVPISDFQQFGSNGTVRIGGAGDITGVYGVEGKLSNAATFRSVSMSVDAGFPIINGARAGGWRSYLDSDLSMGFVGAVDPTHLERGGSWFFDQANDPAGALVVNVAGGYCSLQKNTPSSSYSIFRDEPGFLRNDGVVLEFKCNVTTTGGVGFATGAAIAIWDGTSLFQFDFLFDGVVQTIGLLKDGGDPSDPNAHFLPTTPVEFKLKTLRLVFDPGRAVIELFNVETSLLTPIASWGINRAELPASAYSGLAIGLPVNSTAAVGKFDIYSLKYSYIYSSWESRDGVAPTLVVQPWTEANSGSPGTAVLQSDGYYITCTGGKTLFYKKASASDSNRGGVLEVSARIKSWHPFTRTGAFAVLDDALNAYMLSFVETSAGRYVCIPLAGGAGSFQEYAGGTGLGQKLSIPLDWTQEHVYRLERRPRDGVYLFIDNAATPALTLLDSAGYVFPTTRFSQAVAMFGQFTDEGGISVWKLARTFFGSGYELSTILDQSQANLKARLSDVRTTVVLAAGE